MCYRGAANPRYQEGQKGFDLISYLETHEVGSYEEFIDIIRAVSPESIDENIDFDDISYFDIDIDYDEMSVAVVTMGTATYDRSHGASNTASKSYYTSAGILKFTVNVEGHFSYTTGTCNTVSASGNFSKPFYSFWTSTPTISTGHITTSKAYARISGTAVSGSNTTAYSLTLTCDDSGNFSSY